MKTEETVSNQETSDDTQREAGSRALPCFARLKTNFGFPVITTNGDHSAVWAGDRVTVTDRAGGKAKCLFEYHVHEEWGPRGFEAWVDKSELRFSRQNDQVDARDQ